VESHPYAGPDDLDAIRAVLRAGRIEESSAGYWHPGEVEWWFFYGPDRLAHTTVWSDLDGPAGWVFVDEEGRSADSAVRPDLRGTPIEAEMAAHVEHVLGDGPITLFASGMDAARRTLLTDLGYQLGEPFLQVFVHPLVDPIEVPELPARFHLLDAVTEEWVAERAECHRRAFDPSQMTPERYHAFRRAPDYDPALDVAVAADDGRIVSFAMAWVDEESRSGQLEPVGTRPHFWRRGLGRVANLEALRRMRERGIEVAGVNTWATNASNVAFYESFGFRPTTTLDRFVKPA
jgi:GNAT superfamily N-acetyltransferase